MRNTTNFALPYPESGDHTRTWEFWQGLAEAVDTLLASKFVQRAPDGSVIITTGGVARPMPFAQWAATPSVQVTGATFNVATVTFPASRFTAAPIVQATSATFPFNALAGSVTATGFSLIVLHNADLSTTTTVSVNVHAVEMTPTAGPGL